MSPLLAANAPSNKNFLPLESKNVSKAADFPGLRLRLILSMPAENMVGER